jgi:phosphoribosylaminoimidazole carboxylase (EC 4.1.1.21)
MAPIPPGAWLGCLGGGQLGRMFVHAAQRLGYHVLVLDPDAQGPAAQAADAVLKAPYDDPAALAELAQRAAAITTEFENVPAASLEWLAQHRPVRPAAASVRIAQDRRAEKRFLQAHGLPVGEFAVIVNARDVEALPSTLFPGVLKTATLGYDGKGQRRVADRAEALVAWQALGQQPCVLEARLSFEREISVLVARSPTGKTCFWPVQENEHRHGILHRTIVPARIPASLQARAQALATQVVTALDYEGVMCIEMFVCGEEILLNEIAPRPHNSGHYMIEACVTSQFEQQVRVLAGLPLGDTRQLEPAVMLNLLGDLWWVTGTYREPDWSRPLTIPGLHLHLYGKAEARPGRKMGHLTCTGETLDIALAHSERAADWLGL